MAENDTQPGIVHIYIYIYVVSTGSIFPSLTHRVGTIACFSDGPRSLSLFFSSAE